MYYILFFIREQIRKILLPFVSYIISDSVSYHQIHVQDQCTPLASLVTKAVPQYAFIIFIIVPSFKKILSLDIYLISFKRKIVFICFQNVLKGLYNKSAQWQNKECHVKSMICRITLLIYHYRIS